MKKEEPDEWLDHMLSGDRAAQRVKKARGKSNDVKFDVFSVPFQKLFPDDNIDNPMIKIDSEPDEQSHEDVMSTQAVVGTRFTCRVCGYEFNTLEEQHIHFKTPLHVVNLKRSLVGLESVNEEEDEDSDDEVFPDYDEQFIDHILDDICCKKLSNESVAYSEGCARKKYDNKRGSLVLFRRYNSMWEMSISSAVFGLSLESPSNPCETQDPWTILRKSLRIFHHGEKLLSCVLVLRAGKFAGAVFEGRKCILHKVFRRYTVRAKAGGGQSSFDSSGRRAKSAGATLRRYGEQALKEDIQELLLSWLPYLQSSVVIFTAIPKTMKHYVFGDKLSNTIKPDDSHVKNIPFMMRRVTYEEIKSAHEKCLSIEFRHMEKSDLANDEEKLDSIEEVKEVSIPVQFRIESISTTCHSHDDMSFLDETIPQEGCVLLRQLKDSLRSGDLQNFDALLSDLKDCASTMCGEAQLSHWLSSPHSLETMETLLHVAAEGGHCREIYALLLSGASPMKKDIRNRYPYYLAKDKTARESFRRFRGFCEENRECGIQWDWNLCGIPQGITKDVIKEKKDKEREKKKKARQRKQNAKLQKAELEKETKEDNSSFIAEKEERGSTLEGDCSYCHMSLKGIVPLDVFDRRCCSTGCVAMLRRKLTAEAADRRARNTK